MRFRGYMLFLAVLQIMIWTALSRQGQAINPDADGPAAIISQESLPYVSLLAADGPLTPAMVEYLLAILTNPNIVFLLITIGVQAVLIELSSPGGWVAGFIGVVCLALAFYGLGVLDVNWFGILFLLTAFVLFILDIKAPTHGALTVAGVASLIVGALVLFNSPNLPALQPRVSIPLVVGMSILTGAVFFGVLMFALRAQKVPIRVGAQSLTGRKGRAITSITLNHAGQVQLASERWTAELAHGEMEIPAGALVEVVDVSGVRLLVKQSDPAEPDPPISAANQPKA